MGQWQRYYDNVGVCQWATFDSREVGSRIGPNKQTKIIMIELKALLTEYLST